MVVESFWAVNAYSDKKSVITQKVTPFFIEHYAICLKRVAHLLVANAALFLQPDSFPVEIKSHQHRLASLPCKS
jgi:hypothetical protein